MINYSRRHLLKMVGVVTAVSAAGQLLPISRLKAAEQNNPPIGLKDFISVSQALTAQQQLNPTVAQALLLAFMQTDKNFVSRLTRLNTLFQEQPELLGEQKIAFSADDADSESLAKAILDGWYEGVVGKGFDAIYVTYVNNLANLLVSDKLVPPSFSYGPMGSWAQKP